MVCKKRTPWQLIMWKIAVIACANVCVSRIINREPAVCIKKLYWNMSDNMDDVTYAAPALNTLCYMLLDIIDRREHGTIDSTNEQSASTDLTYVHATNRSSASGSRQDERAQSPPPATSRFTQDEGGKSRPCTGVCCSFFYFYACCKRVQLNSEVNPPDFTLN